MSDANHLYRALQKIHLGGMEPPEVIEKGEIIFFDGKTLKRENGDVVKISQASALATAIRVGWLVPIESSEVDFVTKAAGVEVRSAVSNTEKRGVVSVMTVQDEERDVGAISKIRPAHAPPTHKASDAGKVSRNAPTGAKVIRDEAEGEGRVVGRLKNSAKAGTLEIGKDDRRVVASLTSTEGEDSPWESRPKTAATGDVQEAMSGDELTDILPDAISTGRPKAGVFKDEGVKVVSTGSSVGGQEEGRVISKVGSGPIAQPQKSIPDPEAALREWASSGKANGQALNLREVAGLVKLVMRKVDSLRSENASLKTDLEVLKAASVDPAEVEDVWNGDPDPTEVVANWDMTPHWKTRAVKVVSEYGDNPEILKGILAIEASGVKKAIEKRLTQLDVGR